MTAPREWLSLKQYAALFGIHRNTVMKWREAGLLTVSHVGRIIRVLNRPPGATDPAPVPPVPPPMPALSAAVRRRRTALSASKIRVGAQVVPDTAGVYVIRHGIAAKIGCSTNLRYRLATLQTAQPYPLIIVGVAPVATEHAAYALERALHDACQSEHIRGEWYRLTPAVVALLRHRVPLWHEAALIDDVISPHQS